jgi:hypothetical protein
MIYATDGFVQPRYGEFCQDVSKQITTVSTPLVQKIVLSVIVSWSWI